MKEGSFKASAFGWKIWYKLFHIPASILGCKYGFINPRLHIIRKIEHETAKLLHVLPKNSVFRD